MRALVKQTEAFVKRRHLLRSGASLVVAVSGGADSLALLDVLVHLREKYALTLRVAHVNYQLRGVDSDRDEHLVRAAAKKYALPCSTLRFRAKAGPNLEARLRERRYRFFEDLRQRHQHDMIATAHTLDDQAETVLMRLLQGAGSRGLRGIAPRSGALIRPFLQARHIQLKAYCERYDIAFGEDITNADTRFLRNRVRHQLLPALREGFVPSVETVLARTADVFALENHQQEFLKTFFVAQNPWMRQTALSKREWRRLSYEERTLWVEACCQRLCITISFRQFESLLRLADRASWRDHCATFGELMVLLKDDTLTLTFPEK